MNDSKVNPVEAQAVPDLPVAWATKDCKECVIAAEIEHARNGPAPKGFADYMLGKYTVPLFTRPTPAAADLHQQWRCFHCEEVFTNSEAAALHFGPSIHSDPACQIDAAQLRGLEAELARYREEDTDLHREIHGMQARHQTELRREEEVGYARGLADAVKYPAELFAASPAAAAPQQHEPVVFTEEDYQAIADASDQFLLGRLKEAIDKRLREKQQ